MEVTVHSLVCNFRGSHLFAWGFFILSFQRLHIQIALMMRPLPGTSSKRTLREALTSVSRTSNRQNLDEEKLKLLNKVKKTSTFSFSSCLCLFVHVNTFLHPGAYEISVRFWRIRITKEIWAHETLWGVSELQRVLKEPKYTRNRERDYVRMTGI